MAFWVTPGRDWPVNDIPPGHRSGARITWMLVNRRIPNSIVAKDDVFRAVAMMRVEIPDRNAFTPCFEGMISGDHDRVQITESHCSVRTRMMSGRTHERKTFLPTECQVH